MKNVISCHVLSTSYFLGLLRFYRDQVKNSHSAKKINKSKIKNFSILEKKIETPPYLANTYINGSEEACGIRYIACSIFSYSLFLVIFTTVHTIMAAIKVHGTTLSTATIRVLAAINEKELDYELVLVDMSVGEHKKEHFLSRNVRKIKTFMYLRLFKDQVQICLFQSFYFL